jgi:hypothetical protein
MSSIPVGAWFGIAILLLGAWAKDWFGIVVGLLLIVATVATTQLRRPDDDPEVEPYDDAR